MFNGHDTSSGNGTEPTTSPHRGTVYGGGVLQVQVDTISGSRKRGKCYLKIYQNTRQQGWISNDDVFAKYSQFASIPVWDTTYNNSSDNYTDNKFVDLTKNTQISTQKKSWKLYNLSGYPEDNKNTSSVWPGSQSTSGYPLNIKINNWLDMGGSTIVNLWDSPESWVDGATTIRRNGINLDDFTDYRAKSVVNLRTVNKYYQKYRAPLVPYVGRESQINSYVNEMNMEKRFRTSEGVITHLIEPSSADAISDSVPEVQGLLYYNKFLARHAIVSNGVMNLRWGTSYYQRYLATNCTVSTSYTPNGQATGIGNWNFSNISASPMSIGDTVTSSGDILNNGKLGWVREPGTTAYFSSSTVNVIEAATLKWIGGSTANPGSSGTFLKFESHKSQITAASARGKAGWRNDTIFYPDSNGSNFNNRRASTGSVWNRWHHMPQSNMSGYILGATFFGDLQIYAPSSVWEVLADDVKIKFVLVGTKYSTNPSYVADPISNPNSGTPQVHELCDLIEFNAGSGGSTGTDGSIGPNVDNNDGRWKKFYPNGGNGELSNAIFIGKDGSYTPADPSLGISADGHPGQGCWTSGLMLWE